MTCIGSTSKCKRRVGRSPRLQAAVLTVLRGHPELTGRPSGIARYLRAATPGFEGWSAGSDTWYFFHQFQIRLVYNEYAEYEKRRQQTSMNCHVDE
jgi:hypothetical protein